MKVLAIETSCDETGVAVVEGEKRADVLAFTTLGEALLSQAKLHAQYGGVYPNLAKREHEKNLPIILSEALKIAERRGTHAEGSGKELLQEIDAIAVTEGPGLEPALWTGIEFAKKLALEQKKPLFGVNHMEGHIVSSLARLESTKSQVSNSKQAYKLENPKMPALALLVSGGHTELVLMRDWFAYEMIGRTLDDAVGEAFDKVARMLGLPYPGGPEISKLAARARKGDALKSPGIKASPWKLPRPMIHADSCDMSFSGLKTAALYALRDIEQSRADLKTGLPKVEPLDRALFAREFEDAVGDVLVEKTRRALKETGAKTFVLGGGVAANAYLREKLQALVRVEFPAVEFRLPHLAITGDNAVMIGQAALAHFLLKDWDIASPPADIRASGNLSLA